MADSTISGLTDSGAVLATDQFVIARAGANKSVLGQRIMRYVGSSPPLSPLDGDIWILPADDTNGIDWKFVYDSAETTYKWRFVGGPPLEVDGTPSVAVSSATQVGTSGYYYDPTTMSLVVPRAGDYLVEGLASIYSNGAAANWFNGFCFAGTTRGNRRYQGAIWNVSLNTVAELALRERFNGIAASTRVGIAVQTGNNGTYKLFDGQSVTVRPFRVS